MYRARAIKNGIGWEEPIIWSQRFTWLQDKRIFFPKRFLISRILQGIYN